MTNVIGKTGSYYQRFPMRAFVRWPLSSLIALALSITVAVTGGQALSQGGIIAAGIFGFIVATVSITWLPFLLRLGRPMLVISDEQFCYKDLTVPWEAVVAIRAVQRWGAFVGVELSDDVPGFQELPRFVVRALRNRARMMGVHIVIPPASGLSVEDLETIMKCSCAEGRRDLEQPRISYDPQKSNMNILASAAVFIFGIYSQGFRMILALRHGHVFEVGIVAVTTALCALIVYLVFLLIAKMWPEFDFWGIVGSLT